MTTDDAELLRLYVEGRSESAFSTLVDRHLPLVFHAALRRTGNRQTAEDVAQHVFIALARNAAPASRRAALAGWLYTTTRFAANHAMRTESRRHRRELVAQAMEPIDDRQALDWAQLRPGIDDLMDRLRDGERTAVLLRFFEGRSFAEVGEALRLTEDAARKRVERGITRIRGIMEKRGIVTTAAAIETLLTSQSALAAPAGLASTIVGPALASAGPILGPGAIGTIKLMSTLKITIGVAGVIGIAAIFSLPSVGTSLFQTGASKRAQAALASAMRDYDAASARFASLSKKAHEIDQARAELLAEAEVEATRLATAANRRGSRGSLSGSPGGAAGKADANSLDPLVEGQKFVNAYPQLRSILMQNNQVAILREYAPFIRQANLSPAQAQQFVDLMASSWIDHLAETPAGLGLGSGADPSFEQLSQIMGDQAAQQLVDYEQTMERPYRYTQLASMNAASEGVPLSDQQEDQLAQIFAKNAAPYSEIPGSIGPGNYNAAVSAVNWDAAIAQAKAALPPAQFGPVQTALLQFQYDAERIKAQQQVQPQSGN
jgi:RNA polymerase sigma factor (sigma-70 family)